MATGDAWLLALFMLSRGLEFESLHDLVPGSAAQGHQVRAALGRKGDVIPRAVDLRKWQVVALRIASGVGPACRLAGRFRWRSLPATMGRPTTAGKPESRFLVLPGGATRSREATGNQRGLGMTLGGELMEQRAIFRAQALDFVF